MIMIAVMPVLHRAPQAAPRGPVLGRRHGGDGAFQPCAFGGGGGECALSELGRAELGARKFVR